MKTGNNNSATLHYITVMFLRQPECKACSLYQQKNTSSDIIAWAIKGEK